MSDVCEASLIIPFKSVFSVPIILKTGGVAISFSGTLLFMVKRSENDDDADAIISKTLTVSHSSGSPYHAMLDFTLDDTSHPVGEYFFGFKTGDTGVWLPTKTSVAQISNAVVQGETA